MGRKTHFRRLNASLSKLVEASAETVSQVLSDTLSYSGQAANRARRQRDGNRRAQVVTSRVEVVVRAVRLILACGFDFGRQPVRRGHPSRYRWTKIQTRPNASSATKTKPRANAVHSAIAMGCTSCHEIRVTKDVTRVKLITATPYALCLTCHADKNAADLRARSIRRRSATASSATTRTLPPISTSC